MPGEQPPGGGRREAEPLTGQVRQEPPQLRVLAERAADQEPMDEQLPDHERVSGDPHAIAGQPIATRASGQSATRVLWPSSASAVTAEAWSASRGSTFTSRTPPTALAAAPATVAVQSAP